MFYVGRGRSRVTVMLIVGEKKYKELAKNAEYAHSKALVYSFRLVEEHDGIVGRWRGEDVLLCPDKKRVCEKCKHRFLCYTVKWL